MKKKNKYIQVITDRNTLINQLIKSAERSRTTYGSALVLNIKGFNKIQLR